MTAVLFPQHSLVVIPIGVAVWSRYGAGAGGPRDEAFRDNTCADLVTKIYSPRRCSLLFNRREQQLGREAVLPAVGSRSATWEGCTCVVCFLLLIAADAASGPVLRGVHDSKRGERLLYLR